MTKYDPDKEAEKETGDWLKYIVLIAVGVALFRVLAGWDIHNSALLYVGIPFGLSLVLYFLTPRLQGKSWKRRFWNNVRATLIIMLASSIILMEGYVCVLMFMPIYLFVTLLAFIATYIWHRSKKKSPHAYVLPTLMVLLSLEGTTESMSFSRYNEVSYSHVFEGDVVTLKRKLAQPIALEGERHWLLTVFPKPSQIQTISVQQGEVRRYVFVYHRWFIQKTNTHRGTFEVKLQEVSPNHIKTAITDTSYMSHYMKFHGSELTFEPVSKTKTKVDITVSFDRILDPIWYFGPLERFAVKKSAEYFLHEIFTKERASDA